MQDRLPWFNRVVELLAVAGAIWLLAVAGSEAPAFVMSALSFWLIANLWNGFASTTDRIDARPASGRAVKMWEQEMRQLTAAGWQYLGAWSVALNGAAPSLVISGPFGQCSSHDARYSAARGRRGGGVVPRRSTRDHDDDPR